MISPRQGVVVAGRYALVRQLARGGMGSVWLARHKELEIDVTVKFMAASLIASSEARIRFEREAKIAARLHSQHVVAVLDYGVADDTPYFVMELLKGESLAARLSRDGRMTIPDAAKIVVQIAKALKTAHEIGLVHRDLKPSNIFLSRRDDEEVLKVLDFGVAKLDGLGEATANTESGVLLGTVHYMSPEQIRSSRAVDARSDLWSTGIVLYRALTGKLPFPGRDVGDILVRVCTDPIEPASVVAPGLPPEIDGFFERALARDPEHRFQTAAELADAFCALAVATPVAPRNPPRQTHTLVMPPSLPIAAYAPAPAGPPGEPWSGDALATIPILGRARPSWVGAAVGLAPVAMPESRVKSPRLGRAWPIWAVVAGVTVAAIFFLALRAGSSSASGGARAVDQVTRDIEPPSSAPPVVAPAKEAPSPSVPTAEAAVEAPGSSASASAVATTAPAAEPARAARNKPASAGVRPAASSRPTKSAVNPLDRQD